MIETRDHEQQRVERPLADQVDEHVGGAGEGEELGVDDRADADEEELRRRRYRVLEAVDEALPSSASAAPGR